MQRSRCCPTWAGSRITRHRGYANESHPHSRFIEAYTDRLLKPIPRPAILLLIAAAAIAAYAPALSIPLIADDYPNIAQSLSYGAPDGIAVLLRDAQFRLRATSYWTMFALWQAGEITPWLYHTVSLLLHI